MKNVWLWSIAFILIPFLFPVVSNAQVVLNRDMTSYSQDFNTLPLVGPATWVSGTFYLPGWKMQRTISTTTTFLVGTGSSNAGGLYSYGPASSTDRALGAISSATSTVGEFAWGLLFQNNTGRAITALHLSYTGEQWRSASTAAGIQTTTFWYSNSSEYPDFNLSSATDKDWTNLPALNFSSPVTYTSPGALNGNAAANRTQLQATISVYIPDGHYYMLRWKDLNDLNDDHGLAIDDFSMTWNLEEAGPTPMPVELLYFKSSVYGSEVELDWATASEQNSSHFEIQKSSNGLSFETIGSVPSAGYSSKKIYYTFRDENAVSGTTYYRLKQVDLDGTVAYSKTVTVKKQSLSTVTLFPTVTTEYLTINLPPALVPTKLQVIDKMGRVVLGKEILAYSTNYKLSVKQLQTGNYFIILNNANGQRQVLKFLKK